MDDIFQVLDRKLSLLMNRDIQPSMSIKDAIDICEKIASILDREEWLEVENKLISIEIIHVCPGIWAVSFNKAIWSNSEWYEKDVIANLAYSARANGLPFAISTAAMPLVPILLPYI